MDYIMIIGNTDGLSKGSNKKVECLCDGCGTKFERSYQLLMRPKKAYSGHYCKPCARKVIGKNMDRTNIDEATRNRLGSKHHNWNPDLKEYNRFRNKVYWLSEKVYNENIDILNPNGYERTRCGADGYQLDHIISIKEGYEKGMTVEELSALTNLQLLPWQENRAKWYK